MSETIRMVARTPSTLRRLADELTAAAVYTDVIDRLRARHLLDQAAAAREQAETLWSGDDAEDAWDWRPSRRQRETHAALARRQRREDRRTRPGQRVPSRRALRQAVARLARGVDVAFWKGAPMP